MLLPLIQTLFDIALLRKGPQDIPRSSILLIFAILLWLAGLLCQLALIPQINESDFMLELFSLLIGVTCYAMVLISFGQAPRLTQTLTAILGCGALVAFAFTVVYVILNAIGSQMLMFIAVWTVVLWSISIKGHIIASAINSHWYAGLAIAVSVFILQHIVHAYISAG